MANVTLIKAYKYNWLQSLRKDSGDLLKPQANHQKEIIYDLKIELHWVMAVLPLGAEEMLPSLVMSYSQWLKGGTLLHPVQMTEPSDHPGKAPLTLSTSEPI